MNLSIQEKSPDIDLHLSHDVINHEIATPSPQQQESSPSNQQQHNLADPPTPSNRQLGQSPSSKLQRMETGSGGGRSHSTTLIQPTTVMLTGSLPNNHGNTYGGTDTYISHFGTEVTRGDAVGQHDQPSGRLTQLEPVQSDNYNSYTPSPSSSTSFSAKTIICHLTQGRQTAAREG